MNEMLKRVGQAIGSELEARGIITTHLDILARAAIEAMREPTEAMERAAMDAALDNGAWDVEVYQARIDAALKE